MADKHEKLVLPKDVALTVLRKVGELLEKSETGKKGGFKGSYSKNPAPGMTVKKAENPDKESDAELGEKIEHDVEEHMKENKDAEQKEGHKIFEKGETCSTCGGMHKSEEADLAVDLEILSIAFDAPSTLQKDENWNKPSEKAGQGDTLRRTKSQVNWMEKSELEKHGLSPEQIKSKLKKHGLSPEQIKSKLKKYETENSKKLGYKTSEAGNKERDPEASDKAFNVEGKDHKSSDDQRLNGQTNPQENPKEQAEGNNELAGTTPTQVGGDGKNKPGYDEMKGHLKLAKFIGRMEHKRTLKGSQAQADSSAQHAASIKDKK